MKRIILPGLTTTDRKTWKNKIKEINKFGIKEIALFPTCLEYQERKAMYRLLEKTGLKKIPHVHLRSDFTKKEMRYLMKKYQTEVFNTHADLKNSHFAFWDEYKKIIFIENLRETGEFFWQMVNECGGICLDFSHWEHFGAIQKKAGYLFLNKDFINYKIGCCHISAIRKNNPPKEKNRLTGKWEKSYSQHKMNNLRELDYIKKYVKYLPKYVSIELENSFQEQLEVKKYLEKIINKN